MNGLHVGTLNKAPSGALAFSYTQEWLKTAGARPISLSMPLRHQAYRGEVGYNFFDNLLPDNKQIRDRIQARFKAPTSHPFDLLAAIGMDCVGAVQIAPDREAPRDVRRIEGEPLSDARIAKILSSYRTAPLGMAEEDDAEFRISIAGAQEKTALLWKEKTWHRPLGTTPTTHIFKLPIGKIEHSGMDLSESCENEWLCLKIAEAFGLPVCQAEVCSFAGTKALVVERFDRRMGDGWIMRLPQEDMCQALGYSPNIKYESDGGPGIGEIMRFLLQSHGAIHDRSLFFKSQVLFWLLAAIDGHAKNFSVFIEPEGRFRLTPLYDIMSAHPLIANKQLQTKKIKMAMALSGKNRHYHWHTMQPRHFISTAENVGFNVETSKMLFNDMMDKVGEVIAQVEACLPPHFPDHISVPIFDGMRRQRERSVRPTGTAH
ncbi:MAG: type II toxin-antitoxin system HipA family toxin [Gammaproteobacteria bacterium]|nr:type II toxin-antitoxin system HipA family toxin [Gammaproteobacteria bacterium]MCW8840244.1 type II toxin-antitoxin system HipA family toxin [Gammaproteobacteria bacterium]MCW8972646.1 type II toxin-antitoxin system HipA family toxin [Gammaproteobacteria bacterium]MCW8992389.1 type II toxin-antitoxin system HipA family toxin [Gammaproteobacteria bacterium]